MVPCLILGAWCWGIAFSDAISNRPRGSRLVKSEGLSKRTLAHDAVGDRNWFYDHPLFNAVQSKPMFPDSKTFPDMIPKLQGNETLRWICDRYDQVHDNPTFSLSDFVEENFVAAELVAENEGAEVGQRMESYIDGMWPRLTRSFQTINKDTSLLPLKNPALVPGGRFRESYYWDSLFPFLLFIRGSPEQRSLAIGMLDNFADMVANYGFVLNGNRDYYTGRSQPPVLSMMIDALADVDMDAAIKYISTLLAEYQWWTRERMPEEPTSHGRSVRTANGDLLVTYGSNTGYRPRPEAYVEDTVTNRESDLNITAIYEHIQANAESGWDFSSRFSINGEPLANLRTTEFAPVDLNCLVLNMERVLARLYKAAGASALHQAMESSAEHRAKLINRVFWNDEANAYFDFMWRTGVYSAKLTAATVLPLALNVASEEQAAKTLKTVELQLLSPCGVITTTHVSNQQWDRPMGWAPLQLWAVEGAVKFRRVDLAITIMKRWIANVERAFTQHGRLYEKYDVESCQPGYGGQYPNQAGFLFTNSVTKIFMEMLRNDTLLANSQPG